MKTLFFQGLAAAMLPIVAASAGFTKPPSPRPLSECEASGVPLLRDALDAGWIEFRVVQGRLKPTLLRQGSISYASDERGGQETITIMADAAGGTLEYMRSTRDGEWRLWIGRDEEIDLVQIPAAGTGEPRVRFVQPSQQGEPLALSIQTGEAVQSYAGPTLWHLCLAHPDVVQRRLAPLLTQLIPWKPIEDRLTAVETALLQSANEGRIPRQSTWHSHIDALGDERPSARDAADVALRAEGPALLWFIECESLDLDVEQHHRLHRIRCKLAKHPADETPASTARWLAGDPRIWLSLAGRRESHIQTLAQDALRQLTAVPNRGDSTE